LFKAAQVGAQAPNATATTITCDRPFEEFTIYSSVLDEREKKRVEFAVVNWVDAILEVILVAFASFYVFLPP